MQPTIARAFVLLAATSLSCAAAIAKPSLPPYRHIFVIIEENHAANEIVGNALAPNINRLAAEYGYAANFYAESHPSEPNYVAMLGGDTFGIRDDDAFYCKPKLRTLGCESSSMAGYVNHTVTARSLPDQLAEKGMTWKGYFQDIPQPGSLAYAWPTAEEAAPRTPARLYAAKHNGFVTFRSVQTDPALSTKIVGFDVLQRDIDANDLPNYAHIVPNQCNDMHGLQGPNVPEDCTNDAGLVARADRIVGEIVGKIMASSAWTGRENTAIVITFDESGHGEDNRPGACCGSNPADISNPGGGWIPTVVVTNHGPRRLVDKTAYSHYSLLRTTEAAFGIAEYLGHAADAAKGVTFLTPLFATAGPKHAARLPSSPAPER